MTCIYQQTTHGIIVHGHYTMKCCLLMLQLLMVCNPTIPISFNTIKAEEADYRTIGNHVWEPNIRFWVHWKTRTLRK